MMVPKLRFSEFKGKWQSDLFGNVVTNKSAKYNPSTEEEDLPCLEMDSISQEDGRILHIYSAKQQASIKNRFSSGDVLFGKLRPYLRKYILAPFNGVCSSEVWVLHGLNINNKFLFHYVQTNKFIECANKSSGSKMPRADWSVVSSEMMSFPQEKEQAKIADFLSSVDEKISLLNKQYGLFCRYKKGMIQKIFSQEVRFKDDSGNEFPEWEEVELKQIAIKVNTKNRDNSVSTVLTNSATQGIVSQESYFEREIVTESNLTGYYVVRIGDFVYNPRISSTAPVGPIKMNELTQGVMSPLYTVFRFEKGLLKFYQYFLESSVWHDYMKSVANSGARHDRMNISGADFFGLPVPQPFEEEQTKIAKFLSTLDEKIAVKKAELDKLKTWKQGLLQQMFV
ncbi:restriction endonuclease subunit S [Pantoea sp. B550]|uniref:restriction endonuclease subunit S n=1 Tax=Pantoea sp. B550 TaxID=2959338 RepID=UPI00209FBD7A|nr:restriction endonuclease subunit S [Pantoea sp. B550]MCP1206764.1 restriction endonuclease subunit S [Pantoea sp. B550]